MHLSAALTLTGQDNPARHFETFAASLDPLLIERALAATGTATIRRRKLPADHAVWLILGMGLLRDRPITAVADHLHLVLPERDGRGHGTITSSALVQARDRLGVAPLEYLFGLVAQAYVPEQIERDRWHGLGLFGIDGTTLTVPDSPENRSHFGVPASGKRSESAYPKVRAVGLMALGSHLLAGLKLGAYTEGEQPLADPLYSLVPDASVLVMDRNFVCWSRLYHHHAKGRERHWLVRGKSNLKYSVLKELGPGDALCEVRFQAAARKQDPSLPETMQVRVVDYQRPGFKPQRLFTSLLDPHAYPAADIIALYHERWELENGYDELKTHTLERLETIRSQSPERVRQEVYGLAIVYTLVRHEMARIAQDQGVSRLRLSYRWCLLLMRNLWESAWIVASGTVPRRLEQLASDASQLMLPERRDRTNPRAVRVKMSSYPKKRRSQP